MGSFCAFSYLDTGTLIDLTTDLVVAINNLSPVDLWQNPVESSRAVSYLDDWNLELLDKRPDHGKQQPKRMFFRHD